MTILPLTYLGGIEWFEYFTGGDCIIDVGENWVKQTSRNRAEILTANGIATLTVPVHGYGLKIAAKDVRIDNTRRWQHIHRTSIVSAYRNSAFFDHYEERFANVYAKKTEFLIDLNLELLDIVISVLRLNDAVEISDNYVVASSEDIDLRGKKALRRVVSPTGELHESFGFKEYTQVFYDRMPFVPGLSIIDLLFCEGPGAREIVMRGGRLAIP